MTPDGLLQPTRPNILRQLARYQQLPEVDLLTVYLSGHGDAVDGDGYFIPMDIAEPLADNGLSLQTLFAELAKTNATERFVIVDACRIAPRNDFTTDLSRYSEETNIIFTACDTGQWAPEVPRLEHGLFTYHLLKGLRRDEAGYPGAASADGTVTVLSLLDYVMRGIEDWQSQLTEAPGMPQRITPRVFYNGRSISLMAAETVDPTLVERRATGEPEVVERPRRRDGNTTVTFSVFPWLEAPRTGGRDVATNFSLNLISGHHSSVDGLELGLAVNSVGHDVRGAQLVGGANVVGGDVRAFQGAGLANYVRGNLDGVQAAGGLNYVEGRVSSGLQYAGAVNYAAGLSGVQGAGAVNYVEGDVPMGAQFAGGINVALGSFRGVQAAGGVNYAGDVSGAQIGVVNIGRKVRGAQIGVVNISDELEGVPVGVISYARNGENHLDVWASEIFPFNMAIKTGSRYFHSILAVGAHPEAVSAHGDKEVRRYGYGAGFGGHVPAGPVFMDLQALHYKLNEDELWTRELHMFSQLRLVLGWEIHDRFSLMVGGTMNVLVSRLNDGSHLGGEPFYEYETWSRLNKTWVRMWPGFVAGVQF